MNKFVFSYNSCLELFHNLKKPISNIYMILNTNFENDSLTLTPEISDYLKGLLDENHQKITEIQYQNLEISIK